MAAAKGIIRVIVRRQGARQGERCAPAVLGNASCAVAGSALPRDLGVRVAIVDLKTGLFPACWRMGLDGLDFEIQ